MTVICPPSMLKFGVPSLFDPVAESNKALEQRELVRTVRLARGNASGGWISFQKIEFLGCVPFHIFFPRNILFHVEPSKIFIISQRDRVSKVELIDAYCCLLMLIDAY